MSWKTRKLTRAELSIAFREAWAAARDYRRAGESLHAAFSRNLPVFLDDMRLRARTAAYFASRRTTEAEIEIMQIEAKDFLSKADYVRLSELKSLPLAA